MKVGRIWCVQADPALVRESVPVIISGSAIRKIPSSQTRITASCERLSWSWGCVSAANSEGRTIWIADAHRDNGKRFVARADEKLTTLVELESAD
jgi:hypothetical protein